MSNDRYPLCSDSRCYWVPFIVNWTNVYSHFEHLHTPLVIVEAIGYVLALCVLILGIWVFVSARGLHINSLVVLLTTFAASTLTVITRFVLLLVQEKIVEWPAEYKAALSCLHLFSYIVTYNYVPSFACERFVAALFVRDYEKRPRVVVSILLTICNLVISALLAVLITLRTLGGIKYFMGIFLVSNISVVVSLLVARFDSSRRAALVAFEAGLYEGRYSVSYRWQLEHNLSSAMAIRLILLFGNTSITLFLPAVFMPHLFLSDDRTIETIKLLLNLTTPLAIISFFTFAVLIIDRHRIFLWKKLEMHSRCPEAEIPMQSATADDYFSRLHVMWS